MRPFRQWLGAFTLIEMVVVTACVATLALLFVPALAAAREEKARNTTIFQDVTEAVGLKEIEVREGWVTGAAAWGDYNNDGWPDLLVGGVLWRNEGRRKFTKVEGFAPAGTGIWGDCDNDGFLDVYYWNTGKLLHNIEGKRFEDVSDKLPPRPMPVCRGAAWGDLDGDGYADLFVGGYETNNGEWPSVILRNERGKRFTEAWRTPGTQRTRGVTMADFDESGRLSIFISNYRLQPKQLWYNDGGLRFHDVAAERGVIGSGTLGCYGHSIGSCWGDLDNDGHLDLFVGNFSHPSDYQDHPKFYRNLGPAGNWRFEDKSASAGLRWQESYASPTLGDYDNDGYLDLLYTTIYENDKSVLYHNNGDWTFTDVTAEAGVTRGVSYQAAWADFDSDGRLDLVSGGRLFRNVGPVNHWLKIRLEGTGKINRAAIGSQVRLFLGKHTLKRLVEGATGEGNQNDLTLHFGLGGWTKDVPVEVRWTDGTVQIFQTPPDHMISLRPQGQPTEWPPASAPAAR
jgi:enediyne biosynthesis protein E4